MTRLRVWGLGGAAFDEEGLELGPQLTPFNPNLPIRFACI